MTGLARPGTRNGLLVGSISLAVTSWREDPRQHHRSRPAPPPSKPPPGPPGAPHPVGGDRCHAPRPSRFPAAAEPSSFSLFRPGRSKLSYLRWSCCLATSLSTASSASSCGRASARCCAPPSGRSTSAPHGPPAILTVRTYDHTHAPQPPQSQQQPAPNNPTTPHGAKSGPTLRPDADERLARVRRGRSPSDRSRPRSRRCVTSFMGAVEGERSGNHRFICLYSTKRWTTGAHQAVSTGVESNVAAALGFLPTCG